MKRWIIAFTLCAALAISPLAGCVLTGGESASDFAETFGLTIFDDQDEPGDIDDGDNEDSDDVEDNDGQIPSTVPDLSTAKFSNSTKIDNPYFPLTPGTVLAYSGQTADGLERSTVEVLSDTRVVQGIECRVVRDRVYVDEVLVEDTHDFYAQDDAGNVWYMGEEVDDYNYDDAGNLIDITHDGAWETGKDVAGVGAIARPGYLMLSSPAKGDVYHQEFYPGEAEDMGEVVALGVPVTLADGRTFSCAKTRDFSSADPTIDGYKYYAAGIGVVLEESIDRSERVELTSGSN